MSAGAVAGLIASGAFLVLALFASFALLRLARIFTEVAERVRQTDAAIDEGTLRVREAGRTVDEVNTALAHVNAELARVDTIAAHVQSISGNVAALTSLFAATVGSPAVKVAAFSYGVRQAAAKRSRADVEARVKDELRIERAAARATRRQLRKVG